MGLLVMGEGFSVLYWLIVLIPCCGSGLDICRKNLLSPLVSHTIFKSYWSSRKKKPKLKGLKKKTLFISPEMKNCYLGWDGASRLCLLRSGLERWALASATNIKWAACLCTHFVLFKLASLTWFGSDHPSMLWRGLASDRILMDHLKTNDSFLLSGLNLWHESQMSV